MARHPRLIALFLMAMAVSGTVTDAAEILPLPLPKTLRIQGAGPRAKVWERLSTRERKLAQCLVEAAMAGRDLLFYQSHRHSLAIKHFLVAAFSKEHGAATKSLLGEEAYQELLIYAAKFLDQGGPYGNSNRKYLLSKVPKAKLDELLKVHLGESDKPHRPEILKLLTDPHFETRQYPESPDGRGLETAGGNLYERGLTGAEIRAAMEKGFQPTLNCRVVKLSGKIACEKWTVKSPGVVGKTLSKVVAGLRKAIEFASTGHQKAQIDRTIRYFTDGEIEDFRQANIAWVKDGASSTVDFMMGWVEVYEDWLARIGSWESYVQIVDPEVSRKAQALAHRAQYFEDAMPFGDYKKKFPKHYSPPAIMVYYFQEIAGYRSGGYNLPNFDDIRRDVGAKNVIRLPLPGEDQEPEYRAVYEEMLKEFMPASKVQPALKHRERVWQHLVLMHEIIGHGSGTYDTTKYGEKEDPISALGALGSALEEQRADLAALVFAGDQKLIEIGFYKNAAEAKEMRELSYDYYLTDFLRRTSGQRTFTEAHQRGHWLFVHRLLEKGAIHWVGKDGGAPTLQNQVLAVKDYDRFWQISRELLGELQRIKAVRDEARLRELFEKEAPLEAISEPWAKAIISRGEPLKINAGYVEQPWRITGKGQYESLGHKTLEGIAPYWAEYY